MASALREFLNDTAELYHFAMIGDERTRGLPLIDSPWQVLGIVCVYFLVCRCAPRFWPLRAYELRLPMAVYNLVMVLASAWMCYETLAAGWFGAFWGTWGCAPFRASDSALDWRIVRVCYVFYVSKYVEMIDTFFFIARRRFKHLSTLHVTHHGYMCWGTWIFLKWWAGGPPLLVITSNTGVHTVMYLYYGLAALRIPPRYLTWKRYLTRLQISQFVGFFFYDFYFLAAQLSSEPCYNTGTATMVVLIVLSIAANVGIFSMFARFYVDSYRRPKGKAPLPNPCMTHAASTLADVTDPSREKSH